MNEWFRLLARSSARVVGSSLAFTIACLLIIAWCITGPLFHFSDTWQLVINTATTIVTFLMVFLIQNSQNHDAQALHLKLDEIIRSIHGARNSLMNLEDVSDEQLKKLQKQFERLRHEDEQNLRKLEQIKSCPENEHQGKA